MLPHRPMTTPIDFEHALLNHLAIVLSFSELLLQDSALDDPRRADLAEIHKAAAAAVKMMSGGVPHGSSGATPPPAAETRLDEVEREHIVRVLADVHGNKLAAAKRLGISRRTLYRRLERHGLMETADGQP